MAILKTNLKNIPIDLLDRGEYQPRQSFDATALQELAATIRRVGILEPLIARPKTPQRYEIIAGERRWRAAQIVGLDSVPCLVANYSDEEAIQIALIENLGRQNLNPIEEAEGIARFIEEFGYTHEEAAASIGKPRTEVTNLLRLLKLDSRVRGFIANGALTESHGKILAGLPPEKQHAYAERSLTKHWSIRALEQAIKQDQKKNSNASSAQKQNAYVQRLQRTLSDHLGYPVMIDLEAEREGHVKIRFTTLDELDGILQKVGYEENTD